MTNDGRSSAIMLAARMFVCVLVISVGCSLFWNGLSGRNMFPIGIAIIVAVVVTAFLLLIGFVVVTLADEGQRNRVIDEIISTNAAAMQGQQMAVETPDNGDQIAGVLDGGSFRHGLLLGMGG